MIVMLALAIIAAEPPTCSNWRGWDATHHRDICGPAIRPLTATDLAAFRSRWETPIRWAAQAEYVYRCGLRSAHWYNVVQGWADFGMMRDPRFARLTPAQREGVTNWRIQIRVRATDFLGRNQSGCTFVRTWPFLAQLDRIGFSG
jgi:hypothetical protein